MDNIIEVNGLKIAFYKIDGIRSSTICLKVKAGSWTENKKWGRMHLLEHMLMQGTSRFPKKEDLENFCEDNGIISKITTSGSQIELSVKFPTDNLDNALVYMSEIIFRSTFDNQAMEVEKKVIQREFSDKWSKIETTFNFKTNEQVYGHQHPYSRDGLGDPSFVNETSKENLQELYQKYFVPTNMVMSVAGNIDIAFFTEKLKSNFPLEGNRASISLEIPVPIPDSNPLLMEETGRTSTLFRMSWLLEGFDSLDMKQRIALRIFSYILGGSRRSSLFKEIRDRMGMVYSIGSTVSYYPKAGMFQVYASVNPSEVEEVMSNTRQIISGLIENIIDNNTFERSKRFLKYQKVLDFDSSYGAAISLGNNLFWEGVYVSPEEYGAMVDSIDQNDVRALAKKYLAEAEPFISTLKPKE